MNQFFNINGDFFDLNIINDTINLDDIEVWSLFNNSLEAHPFHIHDVQFCVLDIEGTPPGPQLSGLKDVVLVEPFQTVRFITKFESFTDSVVPYMYHCHVLLHEDKGMIGQFIVVYNSVVTTIVDEIDNEVITIQYNTITINKSGTASVYNLLGQLVRQQEIQGSAPIPISKGGIYLVRLESEGTVVT